LDPDNQIADNGMALGSSRFKADIEQAYQRRVQPGVVGRPRKL